MLSLSLLLAVGGISIDARTLQSTVLVGEPVNVLLVWRSQEPAEVFLGDQNGDFTFLSISVDDGTGPKPYRELGLPGRSESIEAATPLDAVREEYSGVLLHHGRCGGAASPSLMFPRAGEYTLRISYTDDRVGPIEANPLRFTVRAPTGEDAEVLAALQDDPSEIKNGGARARALLARYPASPYLRYARLATFDEREMQILNRRDPRTGEPRWELPQADRDALGHMELRTMADELVADVNWGPLEEARLARAADYYRRAGESGAAEALEQEIIQRFPRSFSAARLRRRSDRLAPSLTAVATPGTLWPPNNKLAPIKILITVGDDRDPSPVVNLVSITCDDTCQPAQDIAGAAFGTDDRDFLLAATRRGAGSGRTYTITYSARDAAGNATMAVTYVTVTHDQRGSR